MLRIARRRLVGTAEIAALILLGAALALAAPSAFAAASGTLALSLNPDSNVLEPGGSVVVTVKNTNAKKSTTVLIATLTNPAAFQKDDGCSGVALGPGKTCQITVTSMLESAPSVDETTTLTVKGKKAGTTSPRSVTLVVFGSGCRVTNTATPTSYTDLQAAVDGASSGDALNLRGTCEGSVTIDKNLTLNGVTGAGTPTLDAGSADSAAFALKVTETASVLIANVTITGARGGGGAGLGNAVENDGSLTLNGSSSVTGNLLGVGSAVVNRGTLTLNDSASVHENSVFSGAGISNVGTLTLNDSASVFGNSVEDFGGGIVNGGTLTMNDDSSVRGNSASVGGGIVNVVGLGVYSGAVAGDNVYDNTPEDIFQFTPPT